MHIRVLSRVALVVGAMAMIAVACSSSAAIVDTSPTSGAPRATNAASPEGPAIPEVLDFSAPRLGGGAIEGADYAGKDLAIWFWAPW